MIIKLPHIRMDEYTSKQRSELARTLHQWMKSVGAQPDRDPPKMYNHEYDVIYVGDIRDE